MSKTECLEDVLLASCMYTDNSDASRVTVFEACFIDVVSRRDKTHYLVLYVLPIERSEFK